MMRLKRRNKVGSILTSLGMLYLIATLTACGSAEAREVEAIDVEGFEVRLEAALDEEQIQELIDQIQEDFEYDVEPTAEQVKELIEDLEIPDVIFTFNIEAVEVNTENDDTELFETPMPINTEIQAELVDGELTTSFGDITFTEEGTFTYRITLTDSTEINEESETQDEDVEEDELTTGEWLLSNQQIYITVIVAENEESEELVANVSDGTVLFEIAYLPYFGEIENQLTEMLEEAWEARVAQAQEDGYELTVNESGDEVYTPLLESAGQQNTTNNNTTQTPNQQPQAGGNGNSTNPAPQPNHQQPQTTPPPAPQPAPAQPVPDNPPAAQGNGDNCEFIRVSNGYIWGNDGVGNPSSQTYYQYKMVCN